MFIFLGGGWKMMALSVAFMLFSNGSLGLGGINIYAIISLGLIALIATKGLDGIREIGASITAFAQRVREDGLARALDFQNLRWQGNFNFNRAWGAGAAAAGGGGGAPAGAPRRATPLTAEEVQLRVNALPTELYATDVELQTRSVKELKSRLANRMIPRRQVDACLSREDLIQLLHSVSGSSASTCVICLEEYESGDAIRILPACQHVYHVGCFNQWAQTDITKPLQCPTCKHDMF